MTSGSVSGHFRRCVVTAGAKTGSAQTGTNIDNGVFVAFAPFDEPEIAIAIIVEKGGTGGAQAPVAVDIINAYFAGSDSREGNWSEGTLTP